MKQIKKTIFDLSSLFSQQTMLDATIHQNHHVNYSMIIDELRLALVVELSELANEVRCFKFWSYKEASAQNVILEEYVDGIHFITSICLFYDTTKTFHVTLNPKQTNKKVLTKQFLKLFKDVSNIKDKQTAIKWYENYLSFGYALGFDINQILKAYEQKNHLNFQRQESAY